MAKSVRAAAMSAAAVGWLVLGATLPAQGVIIHVGDAEGAAGSTTAVDVTLSAEGAEVAGTQNDIGFQPQARIAAKANGKPDCAVNPEIDKTGTSFAFQPPSCTGDACTGVRALVLSLENVSAIPDGSVLYTCQVAIAADAEPGDYALVNTNTGASDPAGQALATTGTDGNVNVPDLPLVRINVGSAEGPAGSTVPVDVSLQLLLLGTEVAGTQNDIAFAPEARIAAKANGKPDCAVNPEIDKTGTSFAFQPPSCAGDACTGVRALVLSLENVAPIPDGSVLYTCQVAIAETAQLGATYPLTCSGAGASTPAGGALSTECTNGQVTVPDVPPTPTATTAPPEPTPTNTPAPTNTRTPRPTSPPSTGCDDDCQIVAPAQGRPAWLWLLPAAALLWLRRRTR